MAEFDLRYLLLVLLLSTTVVAVSISTDRQEYGIGDIVTITLDNTNHSGKELQVVTDDKLYTYSGELHDRVKFKPRETGQHVLRYKEASTDETLASTGFDVTAPDPTLSIRGPRSVRAEDTVTLQVSGKALDRYTLYLLHDESAMEYMGNVESQMQFPVDDPGRYQAQLRDGTRTVAELTFHVRRAQPPDAITNYPDVRGTIKQNGVSHALNESVTGQATVSVSLPGIATNLTLNNVNVTDGVDVRARALQGNDLDVERPMRNAMAIDPSNEQFTNGSIKRTAQGTALWKCKEWNYSRRVCTGSWQRIRSLRPGESYTIDIGPKDPAYAEEGVATVNAKQATYRPGSTAEIRMAVLDTDGFLVPGANVTLRITSPSGSSTTLTTSDGEIIETSTGVYRAFYGQTGQEGRYDLNVTARAPNVSQSMTSYFYVNSSIPYDILRDAPMSIDPRKGFPASIEVQPDVPGPYNFTERLPPDFTVIDTTADDITERNDATLLHWRDRTGNATFSYRADAPDIIPNVEVLGPSYVSYQQGLYEEARPWYLAIDPAVDYYDPNSTQQSGWDAGTGTTHTEVDEGTREPNVPDTSDYVADTANDGAVSEFGFPNVTQSGVTNMTLWVYTGTESNAEYTFSLQQSGTTQCSTFVGTGTSDQWLSCTWNSASGDFSDMTVELGGVNKNGGGQPTDAFVYSTYLQVESTVTDSQNPTVLQESPSDGASLTNDDVTFAWNATDNKDDTLNCDIYIDGSLNKSGIDSTNNTVTESTVYGITDGSHDWNVECTDDAGNTNQTDNRSFSVSASQDDPLRVFKVTDKIFDSDVTEGSGNGPIRSVFNIWNPNTENRTLTEALDNYTATDPIIGAYENTSPSSGWSITSGDALWEGSRSVGKTDFDVLYYNFYVDGSLGQGPSWSGDTLNSSTTDIEALSDEKFYSGFDNPKASTPWILTELSTDNTSYDYSATANGSVQQEFYTRFGEFACTGSIDTTECSADLTLRLDSAWDVDSCGQNADICTDTKVAWQNISADGFSDGTCGLPPEYYGTEFSFTGTPPTQASTNYTLVNATLNYCDSNGNEHFTVGEHVLRVTVSNATPPVITINEPNDDTTTYDYNGITNPSSGTAAFGGPVDNLPPASAASPVEGSEATTAEYDNLSASDGEKYQTTINNDSGVHVYHSFRFSVDESPTDITQLIYTHEGYATSTNSQDADPFYIYIYNHTADQYQELTFQSSGSTSDITNELTVESGFSDYVSGGEAYFLVEGEHTTAGGQNARADMITDYSALQVKKTPVIGGTASPINVTATDPNGVDSCEYRFFNSSEVVKTYTGLEFLGNDIWYNTTDTTTIDDGTYTLEAQCNDTQSNYNNATITVEIFNGAPNASAESPVNGSNFTTTDDIDFLWNATDPRGGSLDCELFVDSTSERNVTLDSGNTANETVSNITDGDHVWNVTCTASNGQSDSTETRNFTIDTLSPVVNQERPDNNASLNDADQSFYYNVSDANTVDQCSLYIDDTLNQTNTSITRDTSQNFTQDFTEGRYNWTVGCTDEFQRSANSSTRNFTIDLTEPGVFLNTSDDINFSNGTAELNFTAVDSFDPVLTCNITVDDSVKKSGIAAENDTLESHNVSVADGDHEWNVTCVDNAGNTNTSETRNFSAVGPPLVELNSPPSNTFDNGTFVEFNYTVDDGDGIDNCTFRWDATDNQTDSDVTNPGTNLFNLSDIPEGRHNWTVRCTDTNDDSRTALPPYNITIDRTAPVVTILGPDNGTTTDTGNLTFNFTVTDNLDPELTCSLNITDHEEDPANLDFTVQNDTNASRNESGIQDGDHYWNASCRDSAANTGVSATWNFTALGAPNINLTDPPDGASQNGSFVEFNYTVEDVNGVENCTFIFDGQENQTDSDINETAENEFNLSSIDEGVYPWKVSCTDTTGESGNSTERNITIDATSPNTTALDPNGTTFNTNDITFNWTVTDNLDTQLACNVTVDEGNYSDTATAQNNTETSLTINDIGEGTHYWNTTCEDDTPNSDTSDTLNFTIDLAPIVNLTRPSNGSGFNTTSTDLFYTVNDTSLSNCSLYINGEENQTDQASEIPNEDGTGENNFTVTNLSSSVYDWSVACTDTNDFTGKDGNNSFQVDFDEPGTELNLPENNATVRTANVTFNWTATDTVDPVLACNVSINNTVNKSNISSPNATPTTTEIDFTETGNYSWSATCEDNTGFTNTSETRNFTIVSEPLVTLKDPLANETLGESTVNYTYVPESFAGFSDTGFCTYYRDGTLQDQNFSIRNGEENYFSETSISEGEHSWYINCTDDNDNVAIGGPRNYTIDLTDPSVDAHQPNNSNFQTSTIRFNWTVTDNIDTELSCDVIVNNTVKASVTSQNNTESNTTLTGLTDGTQYWNTTCTDDGNNANTSETLNFTVQAPPSVGLDAPANETRTDNTTINLYYTASDNSGTINSTDLIINNELNKTNDSITEGEQENYTLTGLTDGTYNWTVNATDPSGNEGTNASGRTFYIDLTPPSITLNEPFDGETFNDNNITFNWTATDFENTYVNCTITVSDPNGTKTATTNETSGTDHVTSIDGFQDGEHAWNVTCSDDLGNKNTSVTQNFTINQPDLATSDANLTFNDTIPGPDENITVFLNVTNIGGNPANDTLVEFWNGDRSTGTQIGNTTFDAGVDELVRLNTSWLVPAGNHTVNAYVDPEDQEGELNETNNNATQRISTLTANITNPPNGTVTNDTTPEINFTLRDYRDNTLNYTIYVDQQPNGQNGTAQDGTPTQVNLSTLSEGAHNVSVAVTDPNNRSKNSTPVSITVDTTAPTPRFETANETFFNTSTPTVSFNLTDNIATELNWTLYRDGTIVDTGTANTSVTTNSTLGPLTNGSYVLDLEGEDDAGNTANGTPITIYVDQIGPGVTLNAPDDGATFTTSSVSLNYTATDNLDTAPVCDIFLDSTVVDSRNASNNTEQSYTATGLSEATHYWNTTCTDAASNTNISETRNFSVFIAPNVTLQAPSAGTVTNNETINFTYNVSDDTGIDRCELRFDGTVNDTDNDVTNNAVNNFTVSFTNTEEVNWSVACTDSTTQQVTGTSDNRSLTVDLQAPNASFETANDTWFNTSTPSFDFNITDDIDTTLNYTFFVDGSEDVTGTVANGTTTSDTITSVTDGSHTTTLEGRDDAGNAANSTRLSFNVDTQAPSVTLLSPSNNTNFSTTDVELNFTTTDNLDDELTCDLVLDGSTIRSDIAVQNDTIENTTRTIDPGVHEWNATCRDEAGNTNTSNTYQFTIEAPDLTIENLSINDSEPIEGETINVSANVTNNGSLAADNVTVEFTNQNDFIENRTVTTLDINASKRLDVLYNTTIGTNTITATADPPLATNGSIQESNETNNQENTTFDVGNYNVVAGNTSDVLRIADANLSELYDWNIDNASESNIFVADTDSDLSFTQLQALARDASNNSQFDDFADADEALNTTGFPDSINATWTRNNQAKELRNFTIFGDTVADVPVVNSTNTSKFKTGLLWDTNDSNAEYNGTQDLVVITEINEDKQGRYGRYDYEVKIPATLRSYKGGTDTVTFYTEIK